MVSKSKGKSCYQALLIVKKVVLGGSSIRVDYLLILQFRILGDC